MNAPAEIPKLYRDPKNRLLGGVAAGLADHLGTSKLLLRMVFVLIAVFYGLGAFLYAAFWVSLPLPDGVEENKRKTAQAIPFLALGIGIFLMLRLSGASTGVKGLLGWLVALVTLGIGLLWHYSDTKVRNNWSGPGIPWLAAMMERDRTIYFLRFCGGGALIVTGIIGVVVVLSPIAGADFSSILYGLLFAFVALAGFGLSLAPILWKMFTQLRAEREARIRERERAEVASMIHDQVLHTLALIQRNSHDVTTVTRLARGQERTLRNWLYRSTALPTEQFSAGLEQVAAEIEDTYAMTVETVVVGDVQVDQKTAALLAATRESLVNAARHAMVPSVSLYAEVEPGMVTVYIRDRGVGFDLESVSDDRHGVRGSILGRMQRHGGKAMIRTSPGEGTEVRLSMPLNSDAYRRSEEELR